MDAVLHIRPASTADRPAMERICARTWDWGDYIPEVWDDWLADQEGALVVGEWDGTVVALGKITFQMPDQAWLEGMRVDPEHRRRGIAGRLLEYSLAYARDHGARVARLGTGDFNQPAHHLTARAAMQRVGRYVIWQADPQAGTAPPSLLSRADADAVTSFLGASTVLDHCHGLYCADWAWQELTSERVAQFLPDLAATAGTGEGIQRERSAPMSPLGIGQIRGHWEADGRLEALAVLGADRDGTELWIGFADGAPDATAGNRWAAVTSLATAIRACAAEGGFQRVRVSLPDLPWLRAAYEAAGFGFGDWEGELWIYEWQLSPRDGGHEL